MKRKGHRNIRLVCLVDVLNEILGQRLIIHSHCVAAIASITSRHSDPRKGSPCLVAFLDQARNDPHTGIVLVESVCELLTGLRQLFPQFESLKGQGIPFVLEGREEGGDRGQGGRPGSHDAGGLDGEEVFEVELVAGDGVRKLRS